jgi:hypothetical protein
MSLATAVWSKTVHRAAGAYVIKDDDTIDEKQVSLLFRVT